VVLAARRFLLSTPRSMGSPPRPLRRHRARRTPPSRSAKRSRKAAYRTDKRCSVRSLAARPGRAKCGLPCGPQPDIRKCSRHRGEGERRHRDRPLTQSRPAPPRARGQEAGERELRKVQLPKDSQSSYDSWKARQIPRFPSPS
jgi:hypothetical protein